MKALIFTFLPLFCTLSVWAQEPQEGSTDFTQSFVGESRHPPVRKIVVFPFDVPSSESKAAENSWWKVREELTQNKRFLIASKQMMLRKDVLVPKKNIDRASAVLLGKHLDADALVVATLRGRELKMTVYSALTGAVLWTQSQVMSTAQPIDQQMEGTSLRLIRDFVAHIPYQGFQILDPIVGKPVFDEGKSKRAKIEVAADSRIERGDLVQWIMIRETEPVYQNNNNLMVFAEGHVVEIERGIATVEIKRLKDSKLLEEKSLVRFPKEATRLQETMGLKSRTTGIGPEIVVAEMKAAQPDIEKHKDIVTTGVTIGSLLALILLAF